MRPPRVLACGASLTGNKGGPGIFKGACAAIRKALPTAEIKMLSTTAKLDAAVAKSCGAEVVDADLTRYALWAPLRAAFWRLLRCVGVDARFLTNEPILAACREADIFIDMSGISFSGDMTLRSWVRDVMHVLPPVLLGGPPIVKFPFASGPFRTRLNRVLARWCLRRVRWVMARGKITEANLRALGVCRVLDTRADTAFLMQPSAFERVDEILAAEGVPAQARPLVGVSASFVMHRKAAHGDTALPNRYEDALAALLDHVQETTGAHVLFVPHSCVRRGVVPAQGARKNTDGPAVEKRLMGLSKLDEDDAWVARTIRERLHQPDKTFLLRGDYPAEELKGIIGRCDAYVASRYHSMVAALSTGVPTMVVGWSHKYPEVLDMFGQSQRVCLIGEMEPARLQELFDDLWAHREQVAVELAERLEEVRDSALSVGDVVAEVIGRTEVSS